MAPNMRPGWAHPYRDPSIWYADGGDPEPEPDPVDDPAGGGDPEPATDPADDWQPPTREEWEAHQASLKRASAEAANRRKWLKAAGYDPKTGARLEPDEPEPAAAPKPHDPAAPASGPSDADLKRAVDRAVVETQLKGTRQMRSFTVGFNEALATAGWNGTRLPSLMKLLDLDAIDIDDDGEITGLAEQIDDIKTEWPELFKRQRANPAKSPAGTGQPGTPAGNVDVADKKPPAAEPKGWAEQVAERLVRG